MAREDLLSLFVSIALRPHSRCLQRLPKQRPRLTRHASTSTNATRKPNLPPRLAPSVEKPHIPLHVGLDRNPDNVSAISRIPIPQGVSGEKFTPAVLSRPLGLQHPPISGENSPVDNRSLSQKRADFANYEKAMERRRVYLRTFFRPYFQEWKRVDHFKGKSFVSSPRLFKREKALYFPNIWGQTLAKEGDGPDGGRDTTPALLGKVSIIGMQSGQWAQEQVDTFIGKESNPLLQTLIEESHGRLQRMDINIQGDWMRALLVKMFSGRLRTTMPEEQWSRYFMIKLPRDIRRGLTDEIRDAIGFLNSQVGYVYLVDSDCRIRWAGSGHAWDGEVKDLNSCIQRLLQEEASLGQLSPGPVRASSPDARKPPKTPIKQSNPSANAIAA